MLALHDHVGHVQALELGVPFLLFIGVPVGMPVKARGWSARIPPHCHGSLGTFCRSAGEGGGRVMLHNAGHAPLSRGGVISLFQMTTFADGQTKNLKKTNTHRSPLHGLFPVSLCDLHLAGVQRHLHLRQMQSAPWRNATFARVGATKAMASTHQHLPPHLQEIMWEIAQCRQPAAS